MIPIRVAVNVSVRQINHLQFIHTVKQILEETKLRPESLEIEITESIMQNINESIEVLVQLRALGVKTAIDDFWDRVFFIVLTKRLPFVTLKIDNSFIDNVSNQKIQPWLKAVIDIGLNLNMNIVAEGVETGEQCTILKAFHCSTGQGYLFSKPIPSDIVPVITKKLKDSRVFI